MKKRREKVEAHASQGKGKEGDHFSQPPVLPPTDLPPGLPPPCPLTNPPPPAPADREGGIGSALVGVIRAPPVADLDRPMINGRIPPPVPPVEGGVKGWREVGVEDAKEGWESSGWKDVYVDMDVPGRLRLDTCRRVALGFDRRRVSRDRKGLISLLPTSRDEGPNGREDGERMGKTYLSMVNLVSLPKPTFKSLLNSLRSLSNTALVRTPTCLTL